MFPTLFKYFFRFFLIAAALFSAFGFSLNKMRCLESGNVEYSFFEAEDCCPPSENNETTLDVQCCEFSKINFQIAIYEILKQDFFKKISFVNFISHFQIFKLSNIQTVFKTFFSDTSPPLKTTEFLSLISVFRI